MSPYKCAAKGCREELKEDDEYVRCGICYLKMYHLKCAEIPKLNGLNDVMKSSDCIMYRCKNCVMNDTRVVNVIEQILSEIKNMQSKYEESNSAVIKRIVELESALKKNGKNMSDEISKVDKKIQESNGKIFDVITKNADENNDGKWSQVVKRKRKSCHPVIVRPTENCSEMSHDGVKKKLNDILNPSELRTSGIRNAYNNSIIITCDDEQTQDKIIDEISKNECNLAVSKPKEFVPRIKLIRVRDATEDDDEVVIENLRQKNKSIEFKDPKILKREKIMQKGKVVDNVVNIVMEVNREDYDKIMTEKVLKYGWSIVKVVDNIYLRRCYKCFGFNHKANECKNERACPECAENHAKGMCNKRSQKKCINCVSANNKHNMKFATNHTAWSKDCKIYQQKMKVSKEAFEKRK